MKKNIKKITWISFIIIGALLIFFPNKAQVQSKGFSIDPVLSPLQNLDGRHAKIDSILYQLVQVYESQGLDTVKDLAKALDIDLVGDAIRIVAEEKHWNSSEGTKGVISLKSQIMLLGGVVEASYKERHQSAVPFYSLRSLADLPSVRYVRLPFKPREMIVSEGVARTGADDFQSLTSYHSAGPAKVAILDGGFKGYESLLGSELPSQVTTRWFKAGNTAGTSVHGAGCAEIVHDMAPNADLYLVNFDTDVTHAMAVDWIIDQGCDVVSYSMGWSYALGPGNGTGPIHDDVKKFTDTGGVWVTSAGNDGQSYWRGNFSDPDSDGRLNFSPSSEWFGVRVWGLFSIWLRWNDWGTWNGSNFNTSNVGADWDMRLYSGYSGGSYLWGSFRNQKTGGAWPYEVLFGIAWLPSNVSFTVNRWWDPSPGSRKFEVLVWSGSNLEHTSETGSIGIPADSEYALAVGAVDHSDDSFHSYSSRGPTNDGRIKPDICAPSGVSTSTYGMAAVPPPGLTTLIQLRPHGFFGTSASCPHVAGAIALYLAKTPFTPTQIVDVLNSRAKDLGATGKDNRFGNGRLELY
jgi:subtilisin family serine protease